MRLQILQEIRNSVLIIFVLFIISCNKYNYNNIFENLGKFVIKVSEGMVKIVEGINLMASSEAMKAFIEFIINIPDDIKDTQFFAEVQKLQKINLHYEDVIWLIDDFGLNYTDEIWRKLSEDEKDKSELC